MAVVITVMSVATILAWAILSGSAIQSQISTNGINAAVADAQAESGVHLAMYYLLNPQYSPVNLQSATPVTLGSGITFASTTQPANPIPGNCSVTVQQTGTNQYYVTSTGSSAGSGFGGGAITRAVGAQVQVNTAYLIQQATTFNCAVTITGGFTVKGSPDAIRSSQAVTISAGNTVTGNIRALSESGSFSGGSLLPAPASPPAPTSADLHDYSQPYSYQGVTYTPVKLGSATISGSTLGPTAGNPLGIFWYNGDVFLAGGETINGTLAVKNGNLWLSGANNTVNPQSLMPAVVIDKQLETTLTNTGLTANGVVYAGTGLKAIGGSPNVTLTINGSLLINTGGITNWKGTTKITYVANNCNVPTLSSANQTAVGVQIAAWYPQ
jgi:hypothetical protein